MKRPAALLMVGVALMAAVWSVTTPPGTAADETDHYIKALALGRGEIRGQAPGVDPTDLLVSVLQARARSGEGDKQLRGVKWVAEGARTFLLPTGLVPTGIGCFNNLFRRAETTTSARCEIRVEPGGGEKRYVSYEAVNPPYTYAFSGAAMRLAGDDNPVRAYRLGRAAMGLVCLVLFSLAVLLLWTREAGALSLLGAMVATTPAAVWGFSVLNPSGLEIAGAICWAAVFLRLLRAEPPPRWIWAAAAAAALVLATARSSGPIFIVLIPLCIGLFAGFGRLLRAVQRLGRDLIPIALCLLVGLAAAFFWLRYIPDNPFGFRIFDFLGDALSGLPRTLREAVGRFAGDYFIPVVVAVAWGTLVAVLCGAAAAAATAPERRRLAILAVAVIVSIAAYATVYLTNGFLEFYGRYALPGLVVLPLCAGWLLAERQTRIPPAQRRRLTIGLAGATGGIQLVAWWLEARRIAVGTDGPVFFFSDATWEPPGGWLPWVLVMLLGTAAYVASGFLSAARDAG